MIKTALASILLCTAAPAFDEAQISQRIKILERADHFAEAVPYYEAWQKLAPDKAPVTHGHARALAAIGEQGKDQGGIAGGILIPIGGLEGFHCLAVPFGAHAGGNLHSGQIIPSIAP